LIMTRDALDAPTHAELLIAERRKIETGGPLRKAGIGAVLTDATRYM